jgi:hypothetical protein
MKNAMLSFFVCYWRGHRWSRVTHGAPYADAKCQTCGRLRCALFTQEQK